MPLPTPALPLAQALGHLSNHVLLYDGPNDQPALMLADLDSGQRVWLTEQLHDPACALTDLTFDQVGRWSADGRFVSIACNARQSLDTDIYWSSTYLFDRQTGTFTHVEPVPTSKTATGVNAVAWSPLGHQLLFQQWSAISPPVTGANYVESWFILDAATGTRTPLADFVSNSHAGWAPNGKVIALTGVAVGDAFDPYLYLISTDGSQRRRIALAQAGRSVTCCAWSPDGQFVHIGTSDVSPHDHGEALRVEIATGVVTHLDRPSMTVISPDGVHYLSLDFNEGYRDLRGRHWAVSSIDETPLSIGGDGVAYWLPDGRLLASVCEFHTNAEATLQEQGRIAVIDMRGQEQTIVSHLWPCVAAFPSADGTLVAVQYTDRLDILDLRSHLKATIQGHLTHGWGSSDQWYPGTQR